MFKTLYSEIPKKKASGSQEDLYQTIPFMQSKTYHILNKKRQALFNFYYQSQKYNILSSHRLNLKEIQNTNDFSKFRKSS